MKRISVILFLCLIEVNLCFALDWRSIHEEADRADLRSSLSESDNISELYLDGLIYLDGHRDQNAEKVFDRILSLDAGTVEAKWGKAEVLRRSHELGESERILNEVIAVKPQFYPAYISLAYIKYLYMDFKECARLARYVITQGRYNVDAGNYVRAHLLYAGAKGMIAHYSGLLSKIIDGLAIMPALKTAESLRPNSAEVMYGLGSFYLLAPGIAGGDIEKAKIYLENAIKADPLFTDAYVRLAQVYRVNKDEKGHQLYLDKALEIDPYNELALDIKNGSCRFICVKKEKRPKAGD